MRLLIIFVVSLFLFSCGSDGGNNNDYGTDIIEEENKIIGIKWEAPTTNHDGTPLEDLGGFKVYYGFSSGDYFEVIYVGNILNYYFDDSIEDGFYCFAVTAYDLTLVNESDYSDELCFHLIK